MKRLVSPFQRRFSKVWFVAGKEPGMTLVEIAIVLMIIGLLSVVTVMKTGTKLTQNARILSVSKEIHHCLMAIDSFYDRYHSYPGEGEERPDAFEKLYEANLIGKPTYKIGGHFFLPTKLKGCFFLKNTKEDPTGLWLVLGDREDLSGKIHGVITKEDAESLKKEFHEAVIQECGQKRGKYILSIPVDGGVSPSLVDSGSSIQGPIAVKESMSEPLLIT